MIEVCLDPRRSLEFAQHLAADVQRDRSLCPLGEDARAHASAGTGVKDGVDGAVRSSRQFGGQQFCEGREPAGSLLVGVIGGDAVVEVRPDGGLHTLRNDWRRNMYSHRSGW